MKEMVFIFIGGYLPGKKYGGPVTSIENFVNCLYNSYDIRIICADHDFNEIERYKNINKGWNKVGNAQVIYINESDYSEKCFHKILIPYADRIVMVYLSGIYYYRMNIPAIRAAKRLKLPIVVAPRGDLMANAISMKGTISKIKKMVFLYLMRCSSLYDKVYIQATSDEEKKGAIKYLGIPKSKIFLIPNLTGKPRNNVHEKKQNSLRMLFISRIMIKKNLLDVIKALELIPEGFNIVFDIFGPIESIEYWDRCQKEVSKINSIDIEVNYKGILDPVTAKGIYQQYDCFVFPTLSENFGHVIAEAMMTNCPVLLTKGTTPWDDYENNGVYLSKLHDVNGLAKNILRFAKMDGRQYVDEITKNNQFIRSHQRIEEQIDQYKEMINTVSLGRDK